MARIHYTTPEGTTGEIDLTAELMTVGRADDNAIIIPDASVSSHHGELSFDGADWIFRDTGSTNGTKIQGELVAELSLTQTPSFTLGSVDCIFIGDEADFDSDSAAAYSAHAQASSNTIDGYGAMPYNGSLRTGFGPKAKPKGNGSAGLMVFGFLAILACGAAIFLFNSMGS
jgi:pSer/pThr/pTyr-binding forkhead associated (FHA) protein